MVILTDGLGISACAVFVKVSLSPALCKQSAVLVAPPHFLLTRSTTILTKGWSICLSDESEVVSQLLNRTYKRIWIKSMGSTVKNKPRGTELT